MPKLAMAPPYSSVQPVSEVLHGVEVTDPYRWLEDQNSARTREWLRAQHDYARSYLDSISGRERVRERIRELLDVETYDSVQKVGERYFFRKRLPGQEQPCIYFREGAEGEDQLLIDPAERGTGPYTALKPLRVSPDGELLLYEVMQGGERSGTFEILEIEDRITLPDVLPRGYLRGFAFASDSKSFYYVHEAVSAKPPRYRAAYHHVLGTDLDDDREIFSAGAGRDIRLLMTPGPNHLGFLILRFNDTTQTDFLLWATGSADAPQPIIQRAEYRVAPILLPNGRILAITNRDAPNFRIVEVRVPPNHEPVFVDLVPESDAVIQDWAATGQHLFVSYLRRLKSEIEVFDMEGKRVGQLPIEPNTTVRLLGGGVDEAEVLFEQESFTQPIRICRYSPATGSVGVLASRTIPFDTGKFTYRQVCFSAKDETQIPMYLVGLRNLADREQRSTIMTSYGGYGVPMTPRFSAFVAFLMERGCLFALPNIRGGSEFGIAWHEAAKRRKRQVAYDDFISAAEWLIRSGCTAPGRLAIFGGSNSGLLVAAVMTQRPELFRAVLCMVPMLDMLRYHLFDDAHVWKDEFGTAEDAEDFAALLGYSPYHNVRDGIAYPTVMIVSGDSDENCNPLHARKMTARLQAATVPDAPIFLDYTRHRGHSPVLPLNQRIEALTDRIALLCDQLDLVN